MVRKSEVIYLIKETLGEHLPTFVDVDDAAEDLASRLGDVFDIYADEPEEESPDIEESADTEEE